MFKKVNEYFFGEAEIAVSDGIYFYGFLVVAVSGIAICGWGLLSNI